GTYRRDVFKAKLHSKKKGKVAAAPAPEVHLSDEKLRKLYDTYLVARQRTGEPVAGLTFDSVATRIRAQVPELLARHKAKNIECKVVIKGGKAVLKAVPLTQVCPILHTNLPVAQALPTLRRSKGEGAWGGSSVAESSWCWRPARGP